MAPEPVRKRRKQLKSMLYEDLLNTATMWESAAWIDQLATLDLSHADFAKVADDIECELNRRADRLSEADDGA